MSFFEYNLDKYEILKIYALVIVYAALCQALCIVYNVWTLLLLRQVVAPISCPMTTLPAKQILA